MCDTWRHRWGNGVIVWFRIMSEPDAINDAFTVQSIWIPFLMITLDLPSSEGACLCPVQCRVQGGCWLWWVPVSGARKLEEGSIRDIKTDVTLAPGPVGTQGLTLKLNQWYQSELNIYILSLGFVKYERAPALTVMWKSGPPTRRFTCKNDWQWLFDCEEYYWVVFRSLCLFDWLDRGKVMVNHQRRSARVIEWTQSGCI